MERDGLRDGVGRRGSARHSADRTLTPPHSLSLPLFTALSVSASPEKKNSKDGGLEGRRVQEMFGEKRSQRNILDPDTGGLKEATGGNHSV